MPTPLPNASQAIVSCSGPAADGATPGSFESPGAAATRFALAAGPFPRNVVVHAGFPGGSDAWGVQERLDAVVLRHVVEARLGFVSVSN